MIEITPDSDSLNSNYDTLDVVCNRCGKCCKIPNTDRHCKYLEWDIYNKGILTCTIYNSRDGRHVDDTPEGKIFCYPRMYEMTDIPGCAYQPTIDTIKRLIKND